MVIPSLQQLMERIILWGQIFCREVNIFDKLKFPGFLWWLPKLNGLKTDLESLTLLAPFRLSFVTLSILYSILSTTDPWSNEVVSLY